MPEKPAYEELEQRIRKLERAESERKQAEEALREKEESLATTLQSIGDGVIATDEQGLVVTMNPVAEKLCGWTLADAAGKPLAEVFRIVNALTRDAVEDPVHKVLDTGKVVGLGNHTMLLSRGGAEYHIADSAAPILNREGRITGVVLVFSDFTEKYTTAERLRLSEERYDLAMEVKNEGMWDWDLVTNKTYFDDRYYTMAGYEPNEFQQDFNGWAEHVHPDDLPHAQEAIRAYLSGESGNFDIEFRFRCKDNSWVWIQGRGKIFERDAGGAPLRMIGTHTDITQRKQAEAALQESEELFRLFAELAPVGIILSDQHENTLYVSRKFTDLFGYNKADMPSVNAWWPLAYPDEKLRDHVRLEWSRAIDEALKTRSEIRPMEFSVTCKDGTLRQIEFRMRTTCDMNVIIFSDITERKEAEHALRDSEEKYRSIYENSVVGFFQSTPDGRFLGVNPAFAKMLGYESPEELVSSVSDIASQTYANPNDRSRYYKALQAHGYVEDFELKVRCKDDSEIWLSDSARAYFDEDGKAVRYEGIVVDISARKRAERIARTLFRISNAVNTSKDLNELYGSIHHILGELIDLTNFYIALYDKQTRKIAFPYFKDRYDSDTESSALFTETGSLTGEVILAKKPLFLKEDDLFKLAAENRIVGTTPKNWIGVPLIIKDEVIGVMAVQSYDDPDHFDQIDLEIMTSVSDQIALAIERKQAEESLKRSHNRFLTVLNSTDATIYVSDMDTHEILFMNQYMLDCFGQDLTGKKCWKEFRGETGPARIAPTHNLSTKMEGPPV